MLDPLPEWPLFGFSDDPRPSLQAARARRQTLALATIVDLDGGGPRPIGTQMVLGPGVASGFLSGGCLEYDVAGHARAVVAEGAARRLVYGQGSPWPDIRLLCGARIEILVEPIAPDDPAVDTLLALGEARAPAFWVSDGARRACAAAPLPAWRGAFRKHFAPTTRLIVLGADPTALAIAMLAAQSGLETTLVRPKGPSEPPPLESVAYRRDAPAVALGEIGLDAWTAVAVATHDAELDHLALVTALPSAAFYVGALGARRRLPDRQTWLRQAGLDETAIARLRAPIGLDIGGKAPWEVAIATLAQIVAARLAAEPSDRSGD